MRDTNHQMYKPGFMVPSKVWRCGSCRKPALTLKGALRLEAKPCKKRIERAQR